MTAVDVVDDPGGHLALASSTGPGSHIAAVVEAWAQTIASPSTRRAYDAAVTGLLAEHGQITAATLAAWRDELVARGLARTTIRQRVAAARAFADWAARVGQLDPQIAAQLREVEPPKVRGEHAPRALPDEAVRLMDTSRPSPSPAPQPPTPRDHANAPPPPPTTAAGVQSTAPASHSTAQLSPPHQPCRSVRQDYARASYINTSNNKVAPP